MCDEERIAKFGCPPFRRLLCSAGARLEWGRLLTVWGPWFKMFKKSQMVTAEH